MKLNPLALAAAFTLAGTGIALATQDSDMASSPAAAQIVAAIDIANDQGLDFGDVVAGPVGGTVVMSAAGVRSVTGDVTLGNAGSAGPAEFTVTGESGATFDVTLPTSILISAGAEDMTVDTFTENANGVLAGGTETFQVGATLHVAASQASGAYSGSFDVTVAYN